MRTIVGGILGRVAKAGTAELGGARDVCSEVDFTDDFLDLAAPGGPDVRLAGHVDLGRVRLPGPLETRHLAFSDVWVARVLYPEVRGGDM